jgi:hypothetical protein
MQDSMQANILQLYAIFFRPSLLFVLPLPSSISYLNYLQCRSSCFYVSFVTIFPIFSHLLLHPLLGARGLAGRFQDGMWGGAHATLSGFCNCDLCSSMSFTMHKNTFSHPNLSTIKPAHGEKQSMCNIFSYLGAESSGHLFLDHVHQLSFAMYQCCEMSKAGR